MPPRDSDHWEFHDNTFNGPFIGVQNIYPGSAPTDASAEEPLWTDGSPYRGLEPFGQKHARIFCGREETIKELAQAVAKRTAGLGMLVLTGPSGVGKSSLLRAGLLPILENGLLPGVPECKHWSRVILTPGTDPLTKLATQLATLSRRDPATVCHSLIANPGESHLLFRQAVLAQAKSRGRAEDEAAGDRLVLIVDQFEELFTLGRSEQAARVSASRDMARVFASVLGAAASAPTVGTRAGVSGQPTALVIIGVRGDYWDHCAALPEIDEALQAGPFTLKAMTDAEFRRAVIGPAAQAGLPLEEGLVNMIIADLHSYDSAGAGALSSTGTSAAAGALPLLSQAMLTTWHNREGNRLTIKGYGAGGGIASAIESTAEAAYQELTPTQQEIAARLFHVMTVVTADRQVTRRPASRQELLACHGGAPLSDVETVLEAFTTRRLLVANGDMVELAHDVLLSSWSRLEGWLRTDLEQRILYGRLREDAETWRHNNHNSSYLYQGIRLSAVDQARVAWAMDTVRYPPNLTVDEFLAAAIAHATRRKRLTRLIITTLSVLLLVSVSAGAVAFIKQGQAETRRKEALSRLLTIQSETLYGTDPLLSGLLAATAWHVAPLPEARYRMLSVLATSAKSVFNGVDEDVHALAYSPDGKSVAVGGPSGTVRLWDTRTREQIGAAFTGHTGAVNVVAYSPDGNMLASGGVDGTVRLWDLTRHARTGTPIEAHGDKVSALAFNQDGKLLATGGNDGTSGFDGFDSTVRVWNVADQQPVGVERKGHAGVISSVLFTPDGKSMISGGTGGASGTDGLVKKWDLAGDGRSGLTFRGNVHIVNSMALSPDGRLLASGGHDGTVQLWDTLSGEPVGDLLKGHRDGIHSVAFTPDGKSLATAGDDGSIRLWDVTFHQQIGAPLRGHTGVVRAIAFSPDGKTLATGGDRGTSDSAGGTLRLWDIAERLRAGRPLRGHTSVVTSLVFSPDGRTLISTGNDATIRLWDPAAGRETGPVLKEPTRNLYVLSDVAFSPDGRTIASASADGTVRLWDSVTRRPVGTPLTGHTDKVSSVAFSPDGKTIASASADGTVRLWDSVTRRPVGTPLTGHTDKVSSVAFSPDGKTIASTDGTVRLWEVGTRRQVGGSLGDRAGKTGHVAFSPDGKILAGAGTDHAVRLWDTTTWRQIGGPLKGHTGMVYALAFASTGKTLASGGLDGTVRLWDVVTRRQIGEPMTPRPERSDVLLNITELAFSPDGKTLAAADTRHTIRLWKMPVLDAPFHEVCAVAGRSLTKQEWSQYIADEPYAEVCS